MGVWRLWLVWGEVAGGRRLCAAALDVGAGEPSRARALYGDGLLAFREGVQTESRERNQAALEVARAVGDREAEALALVGLSRVAFRDGDYQRVRWLAAQAREQGGRPRSLVTPRRGPCRTVITGPADSWLAVRSEVAIGDARRSAWLRPDSGCGVDADLAALKCRRTAARLRYFFWAACSDEAGRAQPACPATQPTIGAARPRQPHHACRWRVADPPGADDPHRLPRFGRQLGREGQTA